MHVPEKNGRTIENQPRNNRKRPTEHHRKPKKKKTLQVVCSTGKYTNIFAGLATKNIKKHGGSQWQLATFLKKKAQLPAPFEAAQAASLKTSPKAPGVNSSGCQWLPWVAKKAGKLWKNEENSTKARFYQVLSGEFC